MGVPECAFVYVPVYVYVCVSFLAGVDESIYVRMFVRVCMCASNRPSKIDNHLEATDFSKEFYF